MLKSSWRVHKAMETKAAVEAAASALEIIIYRMRPVVLENRRAFWFTALNIVLREENRRGLWPRL